MEKVTVTVEGMMCGMCEAHMCDAIRKVIPDAEKVSASRKDSSVTYVTGAPVDAAVIEKAVAETGYTYGGVKTEPYKKKKFLGLF